ncbi:MAG: hypothetical protein PHD88_06335 [Firmicutes bacterium]|nr:hypothetical protein [Bacillota bacterium]MDD4693997.1 hypothetical protein [Bacillota bacterium]
MKPFGLKIEVVLISFAIVFLVIFAGQLLLNHYLVNRPLDRMLSEMSLLDYEIEDGKLTLIWDGKNPEQIVDFIEKKPVHKRFDEVFLLLKIDKHLNLWQEEELIIREGIKKSQYYTALERLRHLDNQAEVVIFEDNYLYVSFLDQGQLYALEDVQYSPIRFISKVVADNE